MKNTITKRSKQGDTISSKLLTLALKNVFKTLYWNGTGTDADRSCPGLKHHKVTDEICKNKKTNTSWTGGFQEGKLYIENSRITDQSKDKMNDILPVLTYGPEAMTLMQKSTTKLKTTQRAMERLMHLARRRART